MDDSKQLLFDMNGRLPALKYTLPMALQHPEFYFNNYEISMLKSLSAASYSGQSRSLAR